MFLYTFLFIHKLILNFLSTYLKSLFSFLSPTHDFFLFLFKWIVFLLYIMALDALQGFILFFLQTFVAYE
jgi:hypothetical protein